MTERTISGFLIAISIISAFMAIFGLFLAEMDAKYDTTYDADSFEVYNQLDAINTNVNETQGQILGVSTDSGILDKLGSFIEGAYSAARTAFSSINLFNSIKNQAVEDANIGNSQISNIISVMITVIVLIALIFILMSALFKWRI